MQTRQSTVANRVHITHILGFLTDIVAIAPGQPNALQNLFSNFI